MCDPFSFLFVVCKTIPELSKVCSISSGMVIEDAKIQVKADKMKQPAIKFFECSGKCCLIFSL